MRPCHNLQSSLLAAMVFCVLANCGRPPRGLELCQQALLEMQALYPDAKIELVDYATKDSSNKRTCHVSGLDTSRSLTFGLIVPQPGYAMMLDGHPPGKIITKDPTRLVLHHPFSNFIIVRLKNNARIHVHARTLKEAEKLEQHLLDVFE